MIALRDFISEAYVSDYSLSFLVIFTLLIIHVVYYFAYVRHTPVVYSQAGGVRDFFEKHMPVIKSTFWPTIWCYESRCQTILRVFIKTAPKFDIRREVITLSDGGEIVVDWVDNDVSIKYPDRDTRPIVLLLPGLTGSSKESYIRHFMKQSLEAGYRPVAYNHRGNGDWQLKTPRTYCATHVQDIAEVLDHIKQQYPNAPLMATGVSLGGMILFNYLAKHGRNTPLDAAMIVSVAWNVFKSTTSLEQPLNKFLFNRPLTLMLRESIQRHMNILSTKFNLDDVFKSQTVREFDTFLTTKMFGYPNVEAYYKDASLSHKVDKIKIPLFCLAAGDDPFAPLHTLPLEEISQSKHVSLLLTTHGGHIGFLDGLIPTGPNFSDRVFRNFIEAVTNNFSALKTLNESLLAA